MFKNIFKKLTIYTFLLFASIFILSNSSFADWNYDWGNRTDRHGKAAGIFAETPFPITESSTSYVIKNDENPSGKTYFIGTKYYVDGKDGNDSNDGLSLVNSKKTLTSALTAVKALDKAATTGINVTIIVRGAHDSFDGIYTGTYALNNLRGIDDTHRVTIVGYNQERPIFDGGDTEDSIFRRSDDNPALAYISLQRVKLTNTQASGVRLGWDVAEDKRDSYFNCVDIWFYSCGNNLDFLTSGNCYYLNADHGYLTHCLFERSVGHGVKIGDGASYNILEWSVSRENGWWPDHNTFYSRTVGIDFPSDRDTSIGNTIRYNIAHGCVSHGLQLRRQSNVTCHHNEIYDFGHGPGMTGDMGGVIPIGIHLFAGSSSGDVYSNIVRDPDSSDTSGILVSLSSETSSGSIDFYNNLIYGSLFYSLNIELDNAIDVNVYNNSIYQNNSTYAFVIRTQTGTITVKNNIIYQAGSGNCGEMLYHSTEPVHQYNLYYHPSGSAAEWGEDGTGERTGDPGWTQVPSGSYNSGDASLNSGSVLCIDQATSLAGAFIDSFNGYSRPQESGWDIGAYEFSGINPPNSFRFKSN